MKTFLSLLFILLLFSCAQPRIAVVYDWQKLPNGKWAKVGGPRAYPDTVTRWQSVEWTRKKLVGNN